MVVHSDDEGVFDWWLTEQRGRDPEWVARVEADIEMARVNREEAKERKESNG